MREIEMQRCDGDVAALHGLEVGVLAREPRRLVAADPVILAAARIQPLDHTLGVDALAEARDLQPLEVVRRKVHVQDDSGVRLLLQHDACELGGERRGAIEREMLAHER